METSSLFLYFIVSMTILYITQVTQVQENTGECNEFLPISESNYKYWDVLSFKSNSKTSLLD